MSKKLGNYQKAIMRALERDGSLPISIKKGYRRQVKRLHERGFIKITNDIIYKK